MSDNPTPAGGGKTPRTDVIFKFVEHKDGGSTTTLYDIGDARDEMIRLELELTAARATIQGLTRERDEAMDALDKNWITHQQVNAMRAGRDALAAAVKVKDAALRDLVNSLRGGRLYETDPVVQRAIAAISPVTTANVHSSAAPQPASDSDATSA